MEDRLQPTLDPHALARELSNKLMIDGTLRPALSGRSFPVINPATGTVIAKAAELNPERFRAVVAADAERLRRNRTITTLNLKLAPVPTARPDAQPAELFRLLEEMEMKSALADARKRYLEPELF